MSQCFPALTLHLKLAFKVFLLHEGGRNSE